MCAHICFISMTHLHRLNSFFSWRHACNIRWLPWSVCLLFMFVCVCVGGEGDVYVWSPAGCNIRCVPPQLRGNRRSIHFSWWIITSFQQVPWWWKRVRGHACVCVCVRLLLFSVCKPASKSSVMIRREINSRRQRANNWIVSRWISFSWAIFKGLQSYKWPARALIWLQPISHSNASHSQSYYMNSQGVGISCNWCRSTFSVMVDTGLSSLGVFFPRPQTAKTTSVEVLRS